MNLSDLLAERRSYVNEQRHEQDPVVRAYLQHLIDGIDAEIDARTQPQKERA